MGLVMGGFSHFVPDANQPSFSNFVPDGSDATPPLPTQTALQRLLGDHPVMGPLQTAIDHIVGAGRGLVNSVTPETTTEKVIGAMPAGLPLYKMFVKPSVDALAQARTQNLAGNKG